MIPCGIKEKCTGCHACVSICPFSCIDMKMDEEGFLYPAVNDEFCKKCGICEKTCPVVSLKNEEKKISKAYGAYHKNEEVRMCSSSGGIFRAIAEEVLRQNGIVYGPVLEKNFTLRHVGVDNKKDLEKLMGSKYVQSEIGEVFQEIKEKLEKGRKILFTGTPCQVEALIAYLKKPYENLFTQDIICHGVPSPAVFKEYIKDREANLESKLEDIKFRDKTEGWSNFSIKMNFENGHISKQRFYKDDYMWAFLKNYTLRPSCYDCAFKTIQRVSDVTLADFWNVQENAPELYDDRGVSLVIVHSEKGQRLLDSIEKDIKKQEVDLLKALQGNPAAVKSSTKPPKRKMFWKLHKKISFSRTVMIFRIVDLIQRAIKRVKKSFGLKK